MRYFTVKVHILYIEYIVPAQKRQNRVYVSNIRRKNIDTSVYIIEN